LGAEFVHSRTQPAGINRPYSLDCWPVWRCN